MSIAIFCDGCDIRRIQAGPNTGAVPLPEGWVQVTIEQKQNATTVQHQCPACFAKMKEAMSAQSASKTPEVRNPIGSPQHITDGRSK